MPLSANSTYYERRLATGREQLVQGSTPPWSLSEWATLLFLPEVRAFGDRAERAALALLMMGHADATASKVRTPSLPCLCPVGMCRCPCL